MSKDDPYRDHQVYHKGILLGTTGRVSALCSSKPRPISKFHLWTSEDDAVTCLKCLRLIAVQNANPALPSLQLLAKLGSLVVHIEEHLTSGSESDRQAILSELQDIGLQEWISKMDMLGLLPPKRG